MAGPRIDIQSREEGNTAVVSVAGEVDMATAPELSAALAQAFANSPSMLVVDLCETVFMDSSGLAAVLTAADENRDTEMVLVCRPESPVRRLMVLTGTDLQIPIYDSSEQAAEH